MIRNRLPVFAALVLGFACSSTAGQKDLAWIELQNGHLVYGTDADHDRIPDFSTAGYEEGNAPIPDVPVKMRV